MNNLHQKVRNILIELNIFLVLTFCENNNIILDISRNSSTSNFSSSLLKKLDQQNNNNSNFNVIPLKNETSTKYKKAFEILNNMNNNKYTMKYIEENRLKYKNNDTDTINYNRSNSPIYLNQNKNKNFNKSSSYLNKVNNISNINNKNEKLDNHKNRSMKKNNVMKLNVKDKEKSKDNNNLHEYKINNMNSSYNNNFTNIKTNKIVFIDLKDNDNNFLKSDLNNDNKYENSRYTRNINHNLGEENILFNSSGNGNLNNKNSKNINNNSNNKLNMVNKKTVLNNNKNSNNKEDKVILRATKNKNENNINTNKSGNKFTNLKMQNLDQIKTDNFPNNHIILEDKKRKEILSPKNSNFQILKNKGLSYKEFSYYVLAKSPILRLCEKMIFSRSTPGLRNILSKDIVISDHEITLRNKIEELEKKIILCDKILDTPFTASKTADITLNFITSLQEIEFKEFPILLSNEEEKKYYLNYLKIIYYLLEEDLEIKEGDNSSVDENNIIINLRKNLYIKINNKGFRSLRDYLYNVFITKKDNIKEISKIDEINDLISKVNNMFEINNSLKICKFISFTLYLVKEIVNFGNNIKSSVELGIKTKNLVNIINRKLTGYISKYKNK